MSLVLRREPALDIVDVNPIPPHGSQASTDRSLALWNPKAIGWWSLVFLPVCPWLTRANWKALGEERRARRALYFGLGISCIAALLMIMDWQASPGLVVWGIWFGWDGWAQIDYLRSKGITDYRHKGFLKPLLLGAVGFFGFIFVMIIVVACVMTVFNPS